LKTDLNNILTTWRINSCTRLKQSSNDSLGIY